MPENEFPPLNDEARAALAPSPVGPFLESTHQRLKAIANQYNAAILVGGAAVTGWTTQSKAHTGSEIRNSAYLFQPESDQVKRYDKIHLVPYSERLPSIYGPQWLKDALLLLAAGRAVQPLHAGRFEDFQPFTLTYSPSTAPSESSGANDDQGAESSTARQQATFVTPICLENIDPVMSARMVRDPATGRKRANFFANLSNDGWFSNQEKYQHLQLLVFRCIENRLPMARCSNTGISAFIDSCGRILQSTALDKPDVSTLRLLLDERETFYMAHPDVLPQACLAILVVAAVGQLLTAASRRFSIST
jgi:apolipoprotein N-acyltransferase